MRPKEVFARTHMLPNEQHIEISESIVRWSRGHEFAIENLTINPHACARLQHDVNRLMQEPMEIVL